MNATASWIEDSGLMVKYFVKYIRAVVRLLHVYYKAHERTRRRYFLILGRSPSVQLLACLHASEGMLR